MATNIEVVARYLVGRRCLSGLGVAHEVEPEAIRDKPDFCAFSVTGAKEQACQHGYLQLGSRS